MSDEDGEGVDSFGTEDKMEWVREDTAGKTPNNPDWSRFKKIGNETILSNSLEELNRVDISELDYDESTAFAEAVESLAYLRESLSEPEECRPNERLLDQPWGTPDDD